MNQLQTHLEKSGGKAKGILWASIAELDSSGEIVMETDEPDEGIYSLASSPEGIQPLIEFYYKDISSEEVPDVVTEDDVLRGAVQVIARHLK